jgi:hypothetical protein
MSSLFFNVTNILDLVAGWCTSNTTHGGWWSNLLAIWNWVTNDVYAQCWRKENPSTEIISRTLWDGIPKIAMLLGVQIGFQSQNQLPSPKGLPQRTTS